MASLHPFQSCLKLGLSRTSSMIMGTNSGSSIPRYFSSNSSSATLQSRSQSLSLQPPTSDVELSYTLYPTNNEALDASQSPLMFLHGLFGAKGNVHSVSKHLSATGRRVVTYDARNHGNSSHIEEMDYPSMAQDLSDLVAELNLSQPAVLGHSMGGKAAMCYALQNPDSLSSLIVADVCPQPSPSMPVLVKYAEAMKRVALPQSGGTVKARKAAQMQLTPAIPDRMVLSFLLTNLIERDGGVGWRMNIDAILKNQELIGDFPNMDAKICQKPTLFLFGAESDQFKIADHGLIKALFPNAHIDAIPEAGHFVHAEKPVEFVEIVQKFLSSVSS